MKKIFLSPVLATITAMAFAGPETLALAPGSTEGAPEVPADAAAAGIPYYEYFHYSAHVKRSYVPGYTPHVTSLFENPRTYPWALCVLATPYYQYAGTPGWFFGSPQGYQSSVPPGSQALEYYRGELGVTDQLARGYPNGMKVVEPAIIPVNASAERGGIYIQGGSIGAVETTTIEEHTETITKSSQVPVPPTPAPAPGWGPGTLEK